MAVQTPPIFKFDVCMYKNDNISTEDFNKYMSETFPPKAAPVIQRNGIFQYAIVCNDVNSTSTWDEYWPLMKTITPPAYREPNRAFVKNQLKQPEWTVPDYNAVVSYWIRDPADMGKLTADPGFAELEKDAPAIANQKLDHLVLGHQTVVFTSDAVPQSSFPNSDA